MSMSGLESIKCIVCFDDENKKIKQYNRFGNQITEYYVGSYADSDEDIAVNKLVKRYLNFDGVLDKAKNRKDSGHKVLFCNEKFEELDGDGAPTGRDARKITRDYLSSYKNQ